MSGRQLRAWINPGAGEAPDKASPVRGRTTGVLSKQGWCPNSGTCHQDWEEEGMPSVPGTVSYMCPPGRGGHGAEGRLVPKLHPRCPLGRTGGSQGLWGLWTRRRGEALPHDTCTNCPSPTPQGRARGGARMLPLAKPRGSPRHTHRCVAILFTLVLPRPAWTVARGRGGLAWPRTCSHHRA